MIKQNNSSKDLAKSYVRNLNCSKVSFITLKKVKKLQKAGMSFEQAFPIARAYALKTLT